jgi:hypothetical protein
MTSTPSTVVDSRSRALVGEGHHVGPWPARRVERRAPGGKHRLKEIERIDLDLPCRGGDRTERPLGLTGE